MKNLKRYRWLKSIVVCVSFAFWITGCRGQQTAASVESMESQAETENDSSISPDSENLELKYTSDGVSLERNGQTVFGPCKFIYDEYEKDRFFRFIDAENGLIGYARNDHGPVSVFIPGSYAQAYPFSERQDEFARVQNPDGTWSIIDENADTILDGFDFINRLPMVENLATGVKDGQAVLLDLDTVTFQTEPSIKKTYPEYQGISEVFQDFAVVSGNDGKQGVIDVLHDEMLVPVQYEDVTWQMVWTETEDEKNMVMFLCQKTDGSYDVISHLCSF